MHLHVCLCVVVLQLVDALLEVLHLAQQLQLGGALA
jgi:hypothetical protein